MASKKEKIEKEKKEIDPIINNQTNACVIYRVFLIKIVIRWIGNAIKHYRSLLFLS